MAGTTDKLRERWERITPRERLMVFVLGGTAVLLVLGWIWLTIAAGLDAIEAKNEHKRKALRALADYRITKAMGGTEPAAPKVAIPGQPIELDSYLERIAKEVGAEIPGYNTLPEDSQGAYHKVSTKVQVRGLDIVQLKDLLYKIESGAGGVIVVEELEVRPEPGQNTRLQAVMVVSTFYDKAAASPSPAPPGEPR